jgi:hypothetical protein
MKNDPYILQRLQKAIEETSSPRAKAHEYTSECLSCLLEECYKIIKNSVSEMDMLEGKLLEAYREIDNHQQKNETRWLFDEQSG